MRLLLIVLIVVWQGVSAATFVPIKLKFAKHLQIERCQDTFRVTIGKQIIYFSKQKHNCISDKNAIILHYPVKQVALFSTTYLGFLERLKTISIVGFVESKKYIYADDVIQRISAGKIVELGHPVNGELIVKYRPTLILDFPPVGVMPNYFSIVKKLKIPLLFITEHYEQHPLARAEWLKLFGIIAGKYQQSVEVFDRVVKNYQLVIQRVPQTFVPFTALIGKLYQGVWNAPAKKSYLVQFLNDLNINYLFADRPSGRQLLSFEQVLKKQRQATHWLPQSLWQKKSDVFKEDKRYKLLSKQLLAHIYPNSRRTNGRGSDYWESGVANPDIILLDLAKIFYPDTFTQHHFFYYRKL